MSSDDLANLENDAKTPDLPIKKERTEKQKMAQKKMMDARAKKQQDQLELKAYREEKQKLLDDKIKEKVAQKIATKAINYKKKHHTHKEIRDVLELDDDDDDSIDSYIEKKVIKKKPSKQQDEEIKPPTPQAPPQATPLFKFIVVPN
jgi:hypothetical protein